MLKIRNFRKKDFYLHLFAGDVGLFITCHLALFLESANKCIQTCAKHTLC